MSINSPLLELSVLILQDKEQIEMYVRTWNMLTPQYSVEDLQEGT